VFHVALTRGIDTVTLVATPTPSPFVAELTTEPGEAAALTLAPPARAGRGSTATGSRTATKARDQRVLAAVGVALVDQGVEWRITRIDGEAVHTSNGRATRVFRTGRAVLTAGGKRGALALPGPADPGQADIVTADRLRRLRRQLADGKPAYTVFDDQTLDAIVAARPGSLQELGRVKGIGPTRLDAYGQLVLEAIASPGFGGDERSD
jgi:superfamily II DNA helicase RecQ